MNTWVQQAVSPSLNITGIRDQIAANKGNINRQNFAFLNPAYYQNAADGGRIGYVNRW